MYPVARAVALHLSACRVKPVFLWRTAWERNNVKQCDAMPFRRPAHRDLALSWCLTRLLHIVVIKCVVRKATRSWRWKTGVECQGVRWLGRFLVYSKATLQRDNWNDRRPVEGAGEVRMTSMR